MLRVPILLFPTGSTRVLAMSMPPHLDRLLHLCVWYAKVRAVWTQFRVRLRREVRARDQEALTSEFQKVGFGSFSVIEHFSPIPFKCPYSYIR